MSRSLRMCLCGGGPRGGGGGGGGSGDPWFLHLALNKYRTVDCTRLDRTGLDGYSYYGQNYILALLHSSLLRLTPKS